MSLEHHSWYYVQCDHCLTCLSATPYGKDDVPTELQLFTNPLGALHRAREAHWEVAGTTLLCPHCSNALDAEHKEA